MKKLYKNYRNKIGGGVALFLLLFSVNISVLAQGGQNTGSTTTTYTDVTGQYTFTINSDGGYTCTITGFTDTYIGAETNGNVAGELASVTELEIPDVLTYNNTPYTVTQIGSKAFEEVFDKGGDNHFSKDYSYYDNITKLTIPESVMDIGTYAFDGWLGLETLVILAGGVEDVEGETENTAVYTSEAATTGATIEAFAFANCTNLTTVYILGDVAEIKARAFAEDVSLTYFFICCPNPPEANLYEIFLCASTSAVETGTESCTIFVPENYEENYKSWMAGQTGSSSGQGVFGGDMISFNYEYWAYVTYDTGVELDAESLSLTYESANVSLTATIFDRTWTLIQEGFKKVHITIAGATVTWASSDDNVVTVDTDGTVTVNGAGEATITATYTDKSGAETYTASSEEGTTYEAICYVTVAPFVTNAALSASTLEIERNGSATLSWNLTWSNDVTGDDNYTKTWASSDENVVKVADGVISVVGNGQTTITATLSADGTDYSETCTVTVCSATGISEISSDVYEVARYNIAGQKISEAQKGINIVKYSDGTTKKVLVK